MTSPADWMESNNRFLSAALTWLRLRLEHASDADAVCTSMGISRKAPEVQVSAAVPEKRDLPSPVPVLERIRRKIHNSPDTGLSPPDSLFCDEPEGDPDIHEAFRRMQEAERTDPPPALLILAERLGLTTFERYCLFVCVAMELDTRIPGLCAAVQGDSHRLYPTFALFFSLFDEPAWDVLSPERALRYWHLVTINQQDSQPLTTSPLRADERIVNYVKGLNYLDDRLTPLLMPFDAEKRIGSLSCSQEEVVSAIRSRLESGTSGHVIQLTGSDQVSKQLTAFLVADSFDRQILRLPADVLPVNAPDLDMLARLWSRENLLLPLALYLDSYEGPVQGQETPAPSPLSRFLSRADGLIFLDTREVHPDTGLGHLVYEVSKPSPPEQRGVWEAVLGEDMKEIAARLACQFHLNIPEILSVGDDVRKNCGTDDPELLSLRVWQACVAETRPRMERLAQLIDSRSTWDDLVLPEEQAGLLRQISDQVSNRATVYDAWGFRDRMNRGLGISVLFTGESGTGKTMAAEVMAADLGLDLYRIDLSAVISKYIGETEKNLRKLFDAAEDGGAILFFDEADALFGKRSEVKDSHDRYANIEINYLLQRMEMYNGLAILATNMKNALDQAFLRRIRFIVNFPFPSQADRMIIWQKVFPPGTPLDLLDYPRLSRLTLTGGSIHNIALGAAFLASKGGSRVTMPIVLSAVKTEYRKLEKPVAEVDAG